MSIQYGVTCLDCGLLAPGVGDGGYLGMPSLEKSPYRFEPDLPTFGDLYAPLRALGLATYELEEFRAFLEAHEGHLLFLGSDHDDPATYPSEVQRLQERLEEAYESFDQFEEHQRRREERTATGEFILAFYGIACRRCRVTYAATEPDLIRTFARSPIPGDAAALFLDRWGPLSADDGWNHRLMDPIDPYSPFMEHLPEFLERHRDHPLDAVLSKTPIEGGLTGQQLEERKQVRQARRHARERILSALWLGNNIYSWYMRRVLAAWGLLNGVPLGVAAAVSMWVQDSRAYVVALWLVAASSLLWTCIGGRWAWLGLSRTLGRSVAKCVFEMSRPYWFSYLFWYLLSELGPKVLKLSPSWTAIAGDTVLIHLWLLPTVLSIGAVAGYSQWHYFHSVVSSRAQRSETEAGGAP